MPLAPEAGAAGPTSDTNAITSLGNAVGAGHSPEMPGPMALCKACQSELTQSATQAAVCLRCGIFHEDGRASGMGCEECRQRDYAFDDVCVLGTYDSALRRSVLFCKDRRNQFVLGALESLYWATLKDRLRQLSPDAVAAVPMHWTRLAWRGINAPDHFARAIAQRLGVPSVTHLLRRRRRTRPQGPLTRAERAKNVQGAFLARPQADWEGAHLLLVDDILTTGATCHEVASVLKQLGVAKVTVAVFARAQTEHSKRKSDSL